MLAAMPSCLQAFPVVRGLKFQATVPLNHFDEEVCATVLKQLWPQSSDICTFSIRTAAVSFLALCR